MISAKRHDAWKHGAVKRININTATVSRYCGGISALIEISRIASSLGLVSNDIAYTLINQDDNAIIRCLCNPEQEI
jgi:hypothetical protein